MESLPNILVLTPRLPDQRFTQFEGEYHMEIYNIDLPTSSVHDLEIDSIVTGKFQEIWIDWTVDYLEVDLVYPLEQWDSQARHLSYIVDYLQNLLTAEGHIMLGITTQKGKPHYDDHIEDYQLCLWNKAVIHAKYQPKVFKDGIYFYKGLQMCAIQDANWELAINAPSTRKAGFQEQ